MRLISIYNHLDRLERTRKGMPSDYGALTRKGESMEGLTACRCGAPRPRGQRACEQCLLADAEMVLGETVAFTDRSRLRRIPRRPATEPQRGAFVDAFRRSFAITPTAGDNPTGTRFVELRLKAKEARQQGRDAVARSKATPRLMDLRRPHEETSPLGVVAVSLAICAMIGLIWWAMVIPPPQTAGGQREADATPSSLLAY